MRQNQTKSNKYKVSNKSTGERNLNNSSNNFSSERSNFNITKTDSGSNTFFYCFSLGLILILNVWFMINYTKRLEEFKENIEVSNLEFQQGIEHLIDIQNKIISNYN